jgi:hypothetical protein
MRETINRSSISRAVLHERGRAIADAIAEAITLITLNKRVDRREANRTALSIRKVFFFERRFKQFLKPIAISFTPIASFSVMILPQVHLRKPCYDFYFL